MSQRYFIATIILSFIIGAQFDSSTAVAFSYKDAKNWGKQYHQCNGKNQSPTFIRIMPRNNYPRIGRTLKFTHFSELPKNMTIRNTGHTVEIKAAWSGDRPTVAGGSLNGSYVFEKITFHWDQASWAEDMDSDPGFHREIDSKDMEMHLFFYRDDLKSFEKAQSQKEGLAVFKIWFLVQNGYLDAKKSFGKLGRIINKVQSINSTAVVPPFSLGPLVTDENAAFVVYKGSLDYPPCLETVTWLIRDYDIVISKALLNAFRKVDLVHGDVSNVRPVQPLNKRQVMMAYNKVKLFK